MFLSSDLQNRLLFKEKIDSIANLIAKNDISNAIALLNDISKQELEAYGDLLLPVLNPQFFAEHADVIAAWLAQYNDIAALLEKPWFKALPLVPEMIVALQKQQAHANADLQEIIAAFTNILKLREVAHLFGNFTPTCQYRTQEFTLERSYPKTFNTLTTAARLCFFSDIKALPQQIFPDMPKAMQQKLRYLNDKTVDAAITPINVVTNVTTTHLRVDPKTGIYSDETSEAHLSAVCFFAPEFGPRLMAIGNVGAGTDYSGIKIYSYKADALELVKDELANSENVPINHNRYLTILHNLKGSLIYEVPVLEQLHGYCGWQSAAELNEFNRLFFKAYSCVTLMPFGDTDTIIQYGLMPFAQTMMVRKPSIIVEQAFYIAKTIHVNLMQFTREQAATELLQSLHNNPKLITIPDTFFQDLLVSAKRHNLSKEFIHKLKQFMLNRGVSITMPIAIYHAYLKSRYASNQAEPEVLSDLEQQIICAQHDKLIANFFHLQNDYDDEQLALLRMQDDTLQGCFLYGYQRARAMAYHAQGPDQIDSKLGASALKPRNMALVPYHKYF